MASGTLPRHVVLTGLPGVGKTTLVRKTCEALAQQGLITQGFYTEELRVQGKRIGFDVVTLDGQRGPLARVHPETSGGQRREYKVGQYSVQLQAFEMIAIPSLRKKPGTKSVIVIDEVGKMEMFSDTFVRVVRDLMRNPNNTVLATIPATKGRAIPLVEEIRTSHEAKLYQVTRENRDHLAEDIISTISESYKHAKT